MQITQTDAHKMLDLLKEIENTMCRRWLITDPLRVKISELLNEIIGKLSADLGKKLARTSKLLDDLKPQEPYLAAVRVVRKQVESAKERSERTTE